MKYVPNDSRPAMSARKRVMRPLCPVWMALNYFFERVFNVHKAFVFILEKYLQKACK
jgi:hypothetical protein